MSEKFFIRPEATPRVMSAREVAPRTAERASTVFVDVAEQSTRAQISRAGFALGEIPLNHEVLASFLDQRVTIRTKVVSQSVVPGTAVARGTAIDVVLASPNDIPVRVIPGVHAAFEDLTMAQLNTQFADETSVRDIVRRRTSAEDLTAAEKQTLTNALQSREIPVDAENTVESAFTGIQAAFTFLG